MNEGKKIIRSGMYMLRPGGKLEEVPMGMAQSITHMIKNGRRTSLTDNVVMVSLEDVDNLNGILGGLLEGKPIVEPGSPLFGKLHAPSQCDDACSQPPTVPTSCEANPECTRCVFRKLCPGASDGPQSKPSEDRTPEEVVGEALHRHMEGELPTDTRDEKWDAWASELRDLGTVMHQGYKPALEAIEEMIEQTLEVLNKIESISNMGGASVASSVSRQLVKVLERLDTLTSIRTELVLEGAAASLTMTLPKPRKKG